MAKKSAGIILYRNRGSKGIEVFLVHPGGPFWKNKDKGAWSIPKGLIEEKEDPLNAAIREFKEETGLDKVFKDPIPISPVRQKGGKVVYAWAFEGDLDPNAIKSNTFEMEWPPRSGKIKKFPEIDRADWFTLNMAREKLHIYQLPIIDELENILQKGKGPRSKKYLKRRS